MKELIEEKKFEMRAYDKVELALLYCPGRSAEKYGRPCDQAP